MQFDSETRFRGNIWNLPIETADDRWDAMIHVIETYLDRPISSIPEKSIRLLEIGVWSAGTIYRLTKHFGPIFDYIGVDPYGELIDDPYKGQFWNSSAEADAVYESAEEIFKNAGGTLQRVASDQFFKMDTSTFDIVFVDGDHRYRGALFDCETGWSRLNPGGLLIVDDYGNSFHPEVEWAVREFNKSHHEQFDKSGALPLFFQLPGMVAPVMLMFVYFKKPG